MAVAAAHAQELGTPASSQIIGNGAPATETLALADKIGADLIVVGRRGLGRIGRLVLGSTSAKIALEAPCAVLTIK